MNDSYDRAVRFLSFAIVPAILAAAGLAWSATRPPMAAPTGASTLSEAPSSEPEREPVVVVGEAVLRVTPAKPAAPTAKPAAAKKPRTCGWYPMYASGDERVWICSRS